MLSIRRKLIFSLVPYALVLIILFLLELGLRIFDDSLASPLYSEASYDGIEWYQINRQYLRKYFPSNVAMLPELKSSVFRKQKAPGAVRVFCLGESSMFGTPYQMSPTIPALVRKQLRHLFPGREWEVINLGASAVNSNVLLDLSRLLVDLEPDAVLVYAGHNEFYGPDGVGASFVEKWFPSLTQIKYRMRELRLLAGFQKLLSAVLPSPPRATDRNMMKEVSQGATVALGSADAERIFENFRRNLTAIARNFKARGIPVIVSDVTSNLTFPPFISSDSLQTERLRELLAGQGPEAARRPAMQLLAKDSTNAMAHFCLGMAELAAGNYDQARRFLVRARDYDLLKFRAPSRTNEIIRGVSREESLPLVSSDSAFASAAPGGLPGRSLFWEHLHPTAFGYSLIADSFLRGLFEIHLVSSDHPDTLMARKLAFDPDILAICWLDLAYADLSMQNLTSRWPFKSFPAHSVVMGSADATLQALAREVYMQKLPWDEGCYRTAEHFRRIRDYRNAVATYNAMIDDYPFNYSRHYLLGNVLKEIGDLESAARAYASAIHLNTSYPYARMELGLILINQGKFDDAIGQLTQALDLASAQKASAAARGVIYYGLAAARANKREYAEAIRLADEAIRLVPSYDAARHLRNELQRFQ